MELREHLLQCLHPGRLNRQGRADRRVRLDELVEVFEISSASPVLAASQKRLYVALLDCFCTVDICSSS